MEGGQNEQAYMSCSELNSREVIEFQRLIRIYQPNGVDRGSIAEFLNF